MGNAKYATISKILKQRINEQIYPVGSLIPNQNELAQEFKVSRLTVKKALDALISEGYLYSKRGSGTYVKKNLPSTRNSLPFNQHPGLSKSLGKSVKSQVISFSVAFPNEDICQQLEISTTEPVYDILRLRIVDDSPYVLEHTFMPINLIPGLTNEILEKSIYSYIKNTLKLTIGDAFRKITAEKSTELDQKYLNSKEHDPVLQISQIVYLEDGRPFEFSTSRHPYDKHAYTMLDIHQHK